MPVFRIEEGPHANALDGHRTYVVDHDREVWLQQVAGLGAEGGDAMVLFAGKSLIPFDIRQEGVTNGPDGSVHFVTTFLSFGGSPKAHMVADIPQHHFRNETERRSAETLATEALLVYGFLYSGDKAPEGHNRVALRDKRGVTTTYTLASFGYPDPARN